MQRREYPPAAHEGGCPPSAEGGKVFSLMKNREDAAEEPLRPFGPPPLSGEAFGAGHPCCWMTFQCR